MPFRNGRETVRHRLLDGAERRAQLLADGFGGNPGLQLHQRPKPEVRGTGEGARILHHHRNEDVGHRAGFGAREALLDDADDLEKVVAHPECTTDRYRIPPETACPIIVRQDSDRMRARLGVVVSGKQAS